MKQYIQTLIDKGITIKQVGNEHRLIRKGKTVLTAYSFNGLMEKAHELLPY